MKRTVDEIKSIRILKARNGVAIIAVLAILLILTLLLPVMFTMSETATKDAVTGTDRQRANYLARAGVEIGVASVKTMLDEIGDFSLPDEPEMPDTSWMLDADKNTAMNKYNTAMADYHAQLSAAINSDVYKNWFVIYEALRDGDLSSKYIEEVNGEPTLKCQRVYCYYELAPGQGVNDITETSYKFISADTFTPADNQTVIGYTDIYITYDGSMKYFDGDGNELSNPDDAYNVTTNTVKVIDTSSTKNGKYKLKDVDVTSKELKEGCYYVKDGYFHVKAVSKVKTLTAQKKAMVVEPAKSTPMGEVKDSKFIEYAGTRVSNAPDFVKKMYGYSLTGYNYEKDDSVGGWLSSFLGFSGGYDYELVQDPIINVGGNQCFVNPEKATAVVPISFLQNDGKKYANTNMYVYASAGNMLLHVDGTPEVGSYVLGVYPGINWKENNNPTKEDFDGVNCAEYRDDVQNANFVSFCSNNIIECDLPIDVRVNPRRIGGTAGRIGDGNEANCDLYKVLNFQAKDIVFNGNIKMYYSFFFNTISTKPITEQCKRAGTVILSAPESTPYSYYNKDRGKEVPAGKVYFQDDVYIWLIEAGNEGTFGNETLYKSGDFTKIKLFNAGDVYYFNAGIKTKAKDGEEVPIGVSLINWYLETQYLNHISNDNVLSFFRNFRHNTFAMLVDLFSDVDTYKLDDMHFIANMKSVPTLEAPSAEKDIYVVWETD